MSKILICAKEEGMRESWKLILEDIHELIVCTDIEQTMDVLQNAPSIKTLILDMDEQEQLDKSISTLRSKNTKLKITVISNHKKEEQAKEIVRNGADGYIMKPLRSEEVLSICK